MNITPFITTLLQSMPVWTIVIGVCVWMIRKIGSYADKLDLQIKDLEKSVNELKIDFISHVPELQRRLNVLESDHNLLDVEVRQLQRHPAFRIKREH